MDYRILQTGDVASYLATLPAVAERLGGPERDWSVREVGDGNLNLVFLIDGPRGSACLKQALPYVRVAGPSWPMPAQRAYYEQAYYGAVAPHVRALVPAIHHYDPSLYCIVMERLTPHIILRQGLIAGVRYPQLGSDLGRFVAHACYFTSDLAVPFEHKMQGIASFCGNTPLIRISVDLIFTDPYRHSARNRCTAQLEPHARALRQDAQIKLAVARLAARFLRETQALIHGDLHSGSIMVTATDTRIIDPEFAFYGPIGFDLGAFFGNLLLSWYSQPGHASREDSRAEYRLWILEQARRFWQVFRATFVELWRNQPGGDAYAASLFDEAGSVAALERERERYLEALFRDMLGFAGCKMIRRIVGFAHVIDFEHIADAPLRARCEAGALRMARRLLTERFDDIEAVLEAVPHEALL
jgi:5-methylthioribose kinase